MLDGAVSARSFWDLVDAVDAADGSAGRTERQGIAERGSPRRRTMSRQLKRPSQSLGDQEGRKGGASTPVAIIWPCSLSAPSYAAAGKQVVVPAQRCPECLGWLMRWGGYWRWLRAPLLVERIWIRRARCP